MKSILTILCVFLLVSCKEEVKTDDEMPAVNDEQVEDMAYLNYGGQVDIKDAIDTARLADKYQTMKVKDTLDITVKGMIEDVCSKKGCWIKLPVGEQTAFVKFKNYGFFLPKNSQGKEVVLKGRAYKSITSVDELRHYAEDEGQTEEEIAAITEEELTLSFLADGALVEEFSNPDVFEPAASE